MPPKKPSSTANSVIDLTDDPIEDLVEAYSTPSSTTNSTATSTVNSDVAIIRTLVDNGLKEPLPFEILSSPPRTLKNRTAATRTARNILTSSDEVTVVKTVTVPGPVKNHKKTPKPHSPVVVIPSDPPVPPPPTIADRKCPVCFDVIQNPSVTLCGHVYCTSCIRAAVTASKQCPICRRKLTAKGFHPLYL